jgi:hypothetical protein
MKLFLVFITGYFLLTSGTHNPASTIKITWSDNLAGDFSFAKRKSIICEAWCYEWAGTDKIFAEQKSKDTVFCYTATNVSTHCSLHLIITGNTCIPTIELISIVSNGSRIYECKDGFLNIDKAFWKKRILKAAFDINFKNEENDKKIFWKGKIYTKIR